MRFTTITLAAICTFLFVMWQMTELMEMKRAWQVRLENMPQTVTVVTHHVKYLDPHPVHTLGNEPSYLYPHFADDPNKTQDVLLYIGCVEAKEITKTRYNLPGTIVNHYGKKCREFLEKMSSTPFHQPTLL